MSNEALERKRRTSGLAGLALAAGLGLLVAAPARAGNDFVDGFEDQMGRMVAAQTFALGQFFVGAAFYPPFAPVVAPAPVVPVYYAPVAEPYPVVIESQPWRRGKGHYKHRAYHGGRGHPAKHRGRRGH